MYITLKPAVYTFILWDNDLHYVGEWTTGEYKHKQRETGNCKQWEIFKNVPKRIPYVGPYK